MSGTDRTKAEIREHLMLQGLMRLPLRPLLKIFRQLPITSDGQTLHPEMQTILLLRKLKKSPGLGDRPPPASRKALRRDARLYGFRPSREIHTEDLDIPMPDGSAIKARHYKFQKQASAPGPLLVFYHGGGFVIGDIDSYDHVCRFICEQSSIPVLSVDYRLAPEYPFPTGLNDAVAAFKWVHAHAERLQADPRRIAVGGDSAGGNFAAHIAQLTSEEGGPQPFYQWLIYPTVDRSIAYPSATLYADGYFLRAKDIEYFNLHYAAGDVHDARVSSIKGKNLSRLAPAFILTAGFDPLRDEGEAYAKALERAGSKVKLMRFPGMIHGFINMIGLSPEAKRNFGEAVQHLKGALNG